MGVFVAHLGLFMLLDHLEPKPKYIPPPKPNFSARSETVIDSDTGERLVYREITISTKLAPEIPAIPESSAASNNSAAPTSTEVPSEAVTTPPAKATGTGVQ